MSELKKNVEWNYVSPDGLYNMNQTITCGHIDGLHMQKHSRFYEVFTFLSDNAFFYVEGQKYTIKKGDVMIFNNKELHMVEFDETLPYKRRVIHFAKEFVLPFSSDKFNLFNVFDNRCLGINNRIPAKIAESANIHGYFDKMKDALSSGLDGNEIMARCYFVQMLIAINCVLSDNNNLSPKIPENDKILKIIEYINSNLSSDLNIDKLSQQFYISKYYMSRLFKATTGYSINQYISYKRIWLADDLISSGMSATEACHSVGYNDYSNFYKTFTKIMGFSPKLSK
ncbi:MAG: AraC family transcriptional regulator [Clostridia bacterium]|nr:AraC family transcriptional regulator [Clostridia bacterium]